MKKNDVLCEWWDSGCTLAYLTVVTGITITCVCVMRGWVL